MSAQRDPGRDPMAPNRLADDDSEVPPEDQPGVSGAEGGSQSESKDKLPSHPSQDSSPLGDTDQHSSG